MVAGVSDQQLVHIIGGQPTRSFKLTDAAPTCTKALIDISQIARERDDLAAPTIAHVNLHD
ncbi:hypothetical protein BN381_130161 [Candidatus Microthrix parvicella RN1]|uniref:Uncharacterized protein n=1 Tax=Candidatus Neomicrothrix parvicella RN1 TaxID=1229780 RepID=R4YWX8_9ACTN|nr:hypothetical protein BN381_130161 [Candidatus Microthrix parvicella RN1]